MAFKVLSALALATGSTPPAPEAGYGMLFASASSLYIQSPQGVVRDLAGTSREYRYYTSSGTWTRPQNITGIQVVAVGGGGGGGSGRVGAVGTNRYGGGGGGGGSCVRAFLTASALTPGAYTITIGAGGLGGTSQTLQNTNGIVGTQGADTSFSSASITFVSASGGLGGNSGSTAQPPATGLRLVTTVAPRGPNALLGGGGAGTPNTTATFNNGLSGGGTGGYISASTNAVVGPSRMTIHDGVNLAGTTYQPNTQPGSAGINGLSNAIRITTGDEVFLSASVVLGYGISGIGSQAGSMVDSSLPSLKGGDGGDYGGGGAGSGGATNGASSGAGGNGGNGLLIIIEYY